MTPFDLQREKEEELYRDSLEEVRLRQDVEYALEKFNSSAPLEESVKTIKDAVAYLRGYGHEVDYEDLIDLY